MKNRDITLQVISNNTIHSYVTSIFPDSIVLRNDFKIVAVGSEIIDKLGFHEESLNEKSIDFLSGTENLESTLKDALSSGSFHKLITPLKTSSYGFITCHISGFYLGLISDFSNYIILQIKQVDEINQLLKQLDSSRNDLDEFIYRAAHDLRGPLATIRGLVNLIKMENKNPEISKLVELLEFSAEKMDDRLSRLHYLSDVGQAPTSDTPLHCDELETSLRATLEENNCFNQLTFHVYHRNQIISSIAGQAVIAVLNNILLYLIQLPHGKAKELSYTLTQEEKGLQIEIKSFGFLAGYELRQAINRKSFSYSNVITYSHITNYFAALKMAIQINASLSIKFDGDEKQHISVFIPYKP